MRHFWRLLVSIIGVELVGILATPFTISAIPTWYATLIKPPFSPPNWLFGPVWTLLYALIGVSFYLIWMKGWKNREHRLARSFFLMQLMLNFLWSLLFFGLQAPLFALVEIILLWLTIVVTMKKFFSISALAFYLLVPYLLWVSFAVLLNASIVVLN